MRLKLRTEKSGGRTTARCRARREGTAAVLGFAIRVRDLYHSHPGAVLTAIERSRAR